jgi:hypothetical protein
MDNIDYALKNKAAITHAKRIGLSDYIAGSQIGRTRPFISPYEDIAQKLNLVELIDTKKSKAVTLLLD